MPGCDKEKIDPVDFDDFLEELLSFSDPDPFCLSHAHGENIFYYYNWTYVDANKAKMCPSPWRVPARSDFNTLVGNTTYAALSSAWGFGGTTNGGMFSINEDVGAFYWSTTRYDDSAVYYLHYHSYWRDLEVDNDTIWDNYGYQVRCVCDQR
jgi:hypothetical protein